MNTPAASHLPPRGRNLLRALVGIIQRGTINPENRSTFPTYMEVFREMFPHSPKTVVRVGVRLRSEGLDELNDWTRSSADLPKVTGLIIDGTHKRPNALFFRSHGKAPGRDDNWWIGEVRKALEHDWTVHVGTQQGASPVFQADDWSDDERAERKLVQVSRLVRDTKIIRDIKQLHAHECQICGGRLELSPGVYYSEGHHLQPLGKPHHGPDKGSNIICVCPVCHVKLDYHAMVIDPLKLRTRPGHRLSQRYIEHHNQRVRNVGRIGHQAVLADGAS